MVRTSLLMTWVSSWASTASSSSRSRVFSRPRVTVTLYCFSCSPEAKAFMASVSMIRSVGVFSRARSPGSPAGYRARACRGARPSVAPVMASMIAWLANQAMTNQTPATADGQRDGRAQHGAHRPGRRPARRPELGSRPSPMAISSTPKMSPTSSTGNIASRMIDRVLLAQMWVWRPTAPPIHDRVRPRTSPSAGRRSWSRARSRPRRRRACRRRSRTCRRSGRSGTGRARR
jgi:hypothetical protein